MCGICGFVGDYSRPTLERMTDSMAHRGPNGRGFYQDSFVGLGHRRLSIIDIEGGQQPIYNEDRSLVLIYNGEIYNFQELRQGLIHSGHIFQSNTDSEVIIHLYEDKGEACVDDLRGMFAFAIWDTRRKTLFLARDRFGIKPLYYSFTDSGKFIFASEIKALLQLGDVQREVNLEALDEYLTFRYVPEEKTMFKNIYKLLPGHSLMLREGRAEIRQYWDISFSGEVSGKEKNDQTWSEAIRDSLSEAVKIRLISDVPLGAYLSGGLDSSFMVGLMSQVSKDPIETFSIGFDDQIKDESKYARIVADHFKTTHHELLACADAVELLQSVIWSLDEPLADAATIPTYMMSKMTKEYVTVVLSGEGADELFGGYDKYKILCLINRVRPMVPSRLFNWLSDSSGMGINLSRVCQMLAECQDMTDGYLRLTSVFTQDEKLNVYSEKVKRYFRRYDSSREVVNKYLGKCENMLDSLMYLDIKTWLPNDVLLKNDKMTMANSIEARVPFLDHKFAEMAAQIPASSKLRWMKEKYILRKAMQGIVPDCIVKRRKHGFTVPIQHWMKGDLMNFSKKILSRKNVENRGFFDFPTVEAIMNKNQDNVFYRRQFWSLLTFELWCQVYIDGPVQNPSD